MFLLRELKAELNPKTIQKTGNPFVVSRLDPEEVNKFDFPRVKPTDIKQSDDLNDEEVVSQMINLAKNSVTKAALLDEDED